MKIVDEAVLDLFRGPGLCEFCGRLVTKREPHHLFCRGMGGGGRLDVKINLIALCAAFSGGEHCHARVHAGKIGRDRLLEIVAAREELTPDEIERLIWDLRRAPKQ